MIGTEASIIAPNNERRFKHGLVFGKFMPPTNGHLYLINFARQCSDKLTVVVGTMPGEPIPGALRFQWLKEIFPQIDIVYLDKAMPQEPAHPQDRPFFQLWADTLQGCCPGRTFDALFASEPYGYKMADVMQLKFIPVDTGRENVKISGTEVRENPFKHWDYLHPVVRPYFLKRIAITGPSTGLAQKMAAHFKTSCVASYRETLAADYAKNIPGRQLTPDDIPTIIRGQTASEEAMALQANRILFIEGDVVLGTPEFPAWIKEAAEGKNYDLYLTADLPLEEALQAIYKKFPGLTA